MNWADIIQWLIAGGLGAGGFKLADLFFLRKPKQKNDINRELRDELRREIQSLREQVSAQSAKIDALEEQLHTYKLDVIARLMTYGVSAELIEEVIKL